MASYTTERSVGGTALSAYNTNNNKLTFSFTKEQLINNATLNSTLKEVIKNINVKGLSIRAIVEASFRNDTNAS